MLIDHAEYLTPNFQMGEFVPPDIHAVPDNIARNIIHCAHRLQATRDILGGPFIITSGYRTPDQNKAAGGASGSYHMKGMAVDLYIPHLPFPDLEEILEFWSGGMKVYRPTAKSRGHVHLDIGPKRRW